MKRAKPLEVFARLFQHHNFRYNIYNICRCLNIRNNIFRNIIYQEMTFPEVLQTYSIRIIYICVNEGNRKKCQVSENRLAAAIASFKSREPLYKAFPVITPITPADSAGRRL